MAARIVRRMRFRVMRRRLVHLSLMSLALAAPVTASAQEITPMLSCTTWSDTDNTVTAFFGYAMTGSPGTTVTIPVGPSNFFSPGAIFRNQPTEFEAGVHDRVFVTSFPIAASQTQLAWFLNGRTVVAKGD